MSAHQFAKQPEIPVLCGKAQAQSKCSSTPGPSSTKKPENSRKRLQNETEIKKKMKFFHKTGEKQI